MGIEKNSVGWSDGMARCFDEDRALEGAGGTSEGVDSGGYSFFWPAVAGVAASSW